MSSVCGQEFMDRLLALRETRERRLWREEYESFSEYCWKRWNIDPVVAQEVIRTFGPMADSGELRVQGEPR